MINAVGFMQGRLSPLVSGKIQAFPFRDWDKEFPIAKSQNFQIMEWTVDQSNLYQNPLMEPEGQKKIKDLCKEFSIRIPSITGDCFMQMPFWKMKKRNQKNLKEDFSNILKSCAVLGISLVVIPLVDNGRIEKSEQKETLKDFLMSWNEFLEINDMYIVFESDFDPLNLRKFIQEFESERFGINYDTGNSASYGFDPKEEIDIYGRFIRNVHIKDRELGGTTVPLGKGNADFERIFESFSEINYSGNFILQTARSSKGMHLEVLVEYRKKILNLMDKYSG